MHTYSEREEVFCKSLLQNPPNGTDSGSAGARLDDFDDSSCTMTGAGCAATAPNHGNKWPVGLDGNFMDPSRAVLLEDGGWYITCGAGYMGACKSPRDDGKVGVPWFKATNSSLKEFKLAGYLINVTASLGRLPSNQWSPAPLPCHFQACPDVFPLGDDPTLFVVISSVYPAWTNEWWIGKIEPGLNHFDTTAFTPIPGAHGVLDHGGVYAAKTGADQVVDQRQSTRRVMFSSTGWQRKGVPGCGNQQTMPRDLSMSPVTPPAPAPAVPYLIIQPAKEVAGLRTHGGAAAPPKFSRAAPATFAATGSQLEIEVNCTGFDASSSFKLSVLQSAPSDAQEAVTVSFTAANSTLTVDHRHANRMRPSTLLQNAPVPESAVVAGKISMRVFVDGGMVETFLGGRIAITSLIGMAPPGGQPAPAPPPSPPSGPCSVKKTFGCLNETNCGGDPSERCLPHLMHNRAESRERCASMCKQSGFDLAGVEEAQCWCGMSPPPARCTVLPDSRCNNPCAANRSETCGGVCAVDAFEFACAPAPAPLPAPPGPPAPLPVTAPDDRGVSLEAVGATCTVAAWQLSLTAQSS